MKIYTSRYGNKSLSQRNDLIKIGITVGTPRFRLGYDVSYLRDLAPSWAMRKLPFEEFQNQYRARLDVLGPDAIRAKLLETGQGSDVVLLCFEDLSKPDQWCHRRIWADWWTEMTGEVIEELQ